MCRSRDMRESVRWTGALESQRNSMFISWKAYNAAKTVYYAAFRTFLHLRLAIRWAIEAVRGSRHSRVPPPILRYKVSESLDIRLFLAVGQRIAERIEQALNDAGESLSHMDMVLDFGCGCGRTIRWLIESFPNTRFYGTDVDNAAIKWCQRNLLGSFCANRPAPPLDFKNGEFDCVYAVSVFTHLDEQLQLQWLAEFRRILRPGGLLLISLHGTGTIERLSPEDAAALRSQGILFKRSPKLRGLHPEFYHTTFQTKEYVLQTWPSLFEIVSYVECGLGYQDLVLLRRA